MIDQTPAAASASLLLPLHTSVYPALLARIADPPRGLWLRGDSCALASPCVAIVGSRAASRDSLEIAERLAADLARVGVTVVSGLARGVDSAAHRGALTTGRTVAILGSGVDVIYPSEHKALADRIIGRGGALVSELAPGSPPRRGHFPRRNRLISGVSLAVVVIEASARSGSLQTARLARMQGRQVFAVPGSVVGERFRGSHALLRDGAKLVESASDILGELALEGAAAGSRASAVGRASAARLVEAAGWAAGAGQAGPAAAGDWGACPAEGGLVEAGERAGEEARERAGHEVEEGGRLGGVLAAMKPGVAYDVQELIVATGLPVSDVLRQVLRGEVDGRLVRAAGPRFIRPHRW